MEFKEYYKDKDVVDSYESARKQGIKAGVFRILERRFVEILLKGCSPNILEAGVGTGFISEILRKHGNLEGFDISPAMINEAKRKFPDMKIQEADILNLKLNKKYDTIVSVRVISHFNLKDATKALSNLNKTLNPSGSIIFNLENRSVIRRLMRKVMNWGSTKNFQYSSEDINKLARESGLKVSKIIYLDHLFIFPLHILNKLLFNSLASSIVKLETKLSNIRFASNNSFIKCQKL